MSKNNLMILAATGLLGMLLYVVLGIVGQVPVPTGKTSVQQPSFAAGSHSPEQTARDSGTAGQDAMPKYEHFSGLLADKGLDAARAIEQYAQWRQQRGFLGADPLLGIRYDQAPARYYEDLDDAALETAAIGKEPGAIQELAARSVATDTVKTIEKYREAASLGSTYALLQIGWLMDTFATMDQGRATANGSYDGQLTRLKSFSANGNLKQEALSWTLAAIRDGGAAIARADVLGWVEATVANLDAEAVTAACAQSIDIMIRTGSSRRAQGRPPLSIEPPPVFLRPADLYDRLPCGNSVNPLEPLVSAEECVVASVLTVRAEPRQLWICKAL